MERLNDQQRDMAEQHFPLAQALANRAINRGVPSDLALSGAMLGLVDAVQRFDPAKDVKFATYAGSRINGQILDDTRAAMGQRGWGRGTAGRMQRRIQFVSVEALASDDDGEVKEFIEAHDDDPNSGFKELIKGFTREEQMMLTLYYIEGLTMRIIGRCIGVSETLVSQKMTSLRQQLKGQLK